MSWLIKFDPPGVHGYVFSTNRLREIRGASTLVEDLIRADVPALFQCYQAQRLYLGGGGGACLLRADSPDGFIAELHALYAERVPGLPLKTAAVAWDERSDLVSALDRLEDALATANPVSPSLPTLAATTVPCHSCGRFAAMTYVHGERFCQTCHTKSGGRREGEGTANAWLATLLKRFAGSLAHDGSRWPELAARFSHEPAKVRNQIEPGELEEIAEAGAGRSGFMALIWCDGDNMSQIFRQKLAELSGTIEQTDQAFAAFDAYSQKVGKAVEDALAEAIVATWPEGPASISVDEGSPPRSPLPAEVLFHGGDDAVIVCAADRALAFSARFAEAYRRHLPDLSASLGVVFAKYHTPIASMLEIADELLRSAKRGARATGQPGGLDFAVLTSLGIRDIDDWRTEHDQARDGTSLTGRPYDFARLGRLLEWRDRVRAISTSRIGDIVDACRQGRMAGSLATYRLLGRMAPKDRGLLLDLFGEMGCARETVPWTVDAENKPSHTVLPDLLALVGLQGRGAA